MITSCETCGCGILSHERFCSMCIADDKLQNEIMEEHGKPKLGGKRIDIVKEPTQKQVGGDHYASQKIQPIDYIQANDIGFEEGNIVKYITRHKLKNGKEDVEKALHYCELLLRRYNA